MKKTSYISLYHSYGLYIIPKLQMRFLGLAYERLRSHFAMLVNALFCKKYHLLLSFRNRNFNETQEFLNPRRCFKRAPSFQNVLQMQDTFTEAIT